MVRQLNLYSCNKGCRAYTRFQHNNAKGPTKVRFTINASVIESKDVLLDTLIQNRMYLILK